MKGMIKILVALAALSTTAFVTAGPITLVSSGDIWDYNFGTPLGSNGTEAATFSDFTTGFTGANTGAAPFGNYTPAASPNPAIYWAGNSALYAQITFTLVENLLGPATIAVASDNGAAIWLNGNLVFQAEEDEGISYSEYTDLIDSSYFVTGLNTLSVLANDYNGDTYFDMILNGELALSVPEPAPAVLLGIGLISLTVRRRQRRQRLNFVQP